ncbi:MAG: deoxyribose-phosphate aldolase [Flavobacteriaceae bacterium]|nr:deoxyribose-phosphate aldolase [Flavobacteriaceae bacterium]
MKPSYLYLGILFLLISCDSKPAYTAQQIVNKAIEKAGGTAYTHAQISFDFRDKRYVSKRQQYDWEYQRHFADSVLGGVKDVWSNKGFRRYIGDSLVQIADSTAIKYGNSVNSVHYFAQLPFGLNDKAVQKSLLGEVEIEGETYYKIRVSFAKEGGGPDFEDIYLYFIHRERFEIDYLAYEFHTNGGGARFRVAYNPRWVNGIRFVDYKNYKTDGRPDNFLEIDSLYQEKALTYLSDISLKNIEVAHLKEATK